MKIFFLSLLLPISFTNSYSQSAIDVTDQTIKIGATKEEFLYFGFAEGDQLVFSFQETDGKELKEIEIIEYPSSSKFSDFKTSKIENKTITISQKGIYKFRFFNGAITGRVCKIKIQRIPASDDTRKFNTNITWITKQDTLWNSYTKEVIAGYDTTYEQKVKQELIKTEQKEELIMDKTQTVHSTGHGSGDKTSLFFTLPINSKTKYETKTVVSWAYWVGVGDDANIAWKENTKKISKLTQGVASLFTSPLGALAIGTITSLVLPSSGEDTYYAISDQTNKELFLSNYEYKIYDNGKGTAGYKVFSNKGMCQGTYYVLLSNDNLMVPIDVNVKIAAIVETKTYEDKQYTETKVKPRYEEKIFKEPKITSSRIPVFAQ